MRVFLLIPQVELFKSVDAALNESEFERVWCRNAADALIVLSHGRFDLLISQATMPDMSGLDIVDRLETEGIDLPCLLLVGPDDAPVPRDASAGVCESVLLSEGFAAGLPGHARNTIAKHQLEQANRIYVAAFESARDGILIADLQGIVVFVNRALESLTGYTREELIGRPSQILGGGEHDSHASDEMWLAVKQRGSWQGERTDLLKDGSSIDVSLTVSPILDSHGRLTHCVVIERDITRRKVVENQLLQAQKLQSLGTLAGGVAHEFNNLLTGIMGYAGLALNHNENLQTREEFLREIMGLAERASELTRQMLAYARQSPMNRRSLSVMALVQATADLVKRSLHQDVAIEQEDDGLPLHIDADANQIEQVLINLILNARDALAGSGSITVTVRPSDLPSSRTGFPDNIPPGAYVELEVSDRGHGMSPDILHRAIDPFFTTKDVGKGTGMGLSVAMGIVRNHRGFLTIQSTPGVGTRVGIFLPRVQEPTSTATPGDSFIEAEPVSPARILVHDDEPAVLDVVRRYLQDAGHQVVCVRDEAELLILAGGKDRIDVAILDEAPPAAGRTGLAGRILELRPRLPLLFCPGDSLPESIPGLAATRRVLCKPFRMNELGFAVQELLAAVENGE